MRQVFIIGCQRCGTTNLYGYLDQHPSITLAKPIRPEPKYFLQKDIKLINTSDYENKYFPNLIDNKNYIGEKSTSYIESKFALNNLKRVYPDAKVIIILREPITRMISNYNFSLQNNLEKLSFDEAIKKESSRNSYSNVSVSPYAYKERSLYINYLRDVYEIFHSDQIKVIIFEELKSNLVTLTNLWKWLEVSPILVKDNLKFKNETLPNPNFKSDLIPSLAKEFAKYNSQIEELLKIDLSIWKKEAWYDCVQ